MYLEMLDRPFHLVLSILKVQLHFNEIQVQLLWKNGLEFSTVAVLDL